MSVFHEGELAVQRLAGVRAEADRLSGMLAPPHLDGAARFLGERTFAALTGRDAEGRLWTSPLVGPPGFLDAEATTLRVHALPPSGDPLRDHQQCHPPAPRRSRPCGRGTTRRSGGAVRS